MEDASRKALVAEYREEGFERRGLLRGGEVTYLESFEGEGRCKGVQGGARDRRWGDVRSFGGIFACLSPFSIHLWGKMGKANPFIMGKQIYQERFFPFS